MQQGGGLSVHITISTSRFLKEYPLPKKLTVAQYTLTLWTHVYPAGLRYAPAAAGPKRAYSLTHTRWDRDEVAGNTSGHLASSLRTNSIYLC